MAEGEPRAGEIEQIYALVVARHGQRLDAEGAAAVRANIERLQHAAALIAAFPLTHQEEPFAMFRAATADID